MANFSDYYRECNSEQQHCLRMLLANIYFEDQLDQLASALLWSDESEHPTARDVATMNRLRFGVEEWITRPDAFDHIEAIFMQVVDSDPSIKSLGDLVDRFRDTTGRLRPDDRKDLLAETTRILSQAFPKEQVDLVARLNLVPGEARAHGWHRVTPEG